MNIIQRNCIRLLREGAFNEHLTLEPMSAWKWERALVFAQIHDITPWVFDGIRQSADDFFLRLDASLLANWQQATIHAVSEQAEADIDKQETEEQRLSNPLLNRKLRRLLQQAEKEISIESLQATKAFMLRLVGISRNLLTQGIHLRRFVELAIYLQTTRDNIDYEHIRSWITQLYMEHVASLTASVLVSLFDFDAGNIPFAEASSPKEAQQLIREFMKISGNELDEWYFTQGDHVFVGTNNSSSLIWHVRHSFRYMYVFPQESPFNLLGNFIHSLSHIEE